MDNCIPEHTWCHYMSDEHTCIITGLMKIPDVNTCLMNISNVITRLMNIPVWWTYLPDEHTGRHYTSDEHTWCHYTSDEHTWYHYRSDEHTWCHYRSRSGKETAPGGVPHTSPPCRKSSHWKRIYLKLDVYMNKFSHRFWGYEQKEKTDEHITLKTRTYPPA